MSRIGWVPTGRGMSLSNSVKPGQFRATRYNIVPNKTVINNNFYGGGYNAGYFDNVCCQQESSMPKWMGWMMGIGMLNSLLGGIFGLFGNNKTEQAPETETEVETPVQPETEPEDVQPEEEVAAPVEVPVADPVEAGGDPIEQTAQLFENLSNTILATDEKLGSNYDIQGTTKFKWNTNADGTEDKNTPPSSITINCAGKDYVFQYQGTENGKPMYKASEVIVNGQSHPVLNNQFYTLDADSGKLVQNATNSSAEDGLGTTIKWRR